MKDSYLYPNTEILINKFDIKDIGLLNSLEADFTSSRLKVIIQYGIPDLVDKSKLEYLVKIIKDAIERGKNV